MTIIKVNDLYSKFLRILHAILIFLLRIQLEEKHIHVSFSNWISSFSYSEIKTSINDRMLFNWKKYPSIDIELLKRIKAWDCFEYISMSMILFYILRSFDGTFIHIQTFTAILFVWSFICWDSNAQHIIQNVNKEYWRSIQNANEYLSTVILDSNLLQQILHFGVTYLSKAHTNCLKHSFIQPLTLHLGICQYR